MGVIGPFDSDLFSGTVPIFPLPDVVLLPHGLLPLHIFEPRYRAMTRAALDGERLIAMALLQSTGKPDAPETPPVHPVVGVGRVLQETELPDGRFNILLCGVARMRILQEVQDEPYRVARMEVLKEREAIGKSYERKRNLLLSFYRQVLAELLKEQSPPPPDDLSLGALCDLLTSVIRVKTPFKQSLLEELDVATRCDRLIEYLRGANAPGFGAPSSWPPATSPN